MTRFALSSALDLVVLGAFLVALLVWADYLAQ